METFKTLVSLTMLGLSTPNFTQFISTLNPKAAEISTKVYLAGAAFAIGLTLFI